MHFENEDREELKPYLNKTINCIGTFSGVRYLHHNYKDIIHILFKDLKINNELTISHAWITYDEDAFKDIFFGAYDILQFDCEVEEYIDKDNNFKYGLCNISDIKNLSNNNLLIDNIIFKVVDVKFMKSYFGDKPEEALASELIMIDYNIDIRKEYTLVLKEKQKADLVSYYIYDKGKEMEDVSAKFHPYKQKHGLNIRFDYYCDVNEQAYRDLCINFFIEKILKKRLSSEI